MSETFPPASDKDKKTVHQSVSASEGSTVKNVVQIGGDFDGVLLVGDVVVRDVGHLSFDNASRIQNFFDKYLGTPDHPVPFGGRESEMTVLDKWLLDSKAPPYCLLAVQPDRFTLQFRIQMTFARGLLLITPRHCVF